MRNCLHNFYKNEAIIIGRLVISVHPTTHSVLIYQMCFKNKIISSNFGQKNGISQDVLILLIENNLRQLGLNTTSLYFKDNK